MNPLKLIVLGAAGLLAAGCNVITVKDDVDTVWDFKELLGPSDEMHTPYVAGASLNVYVESTDNNEKMEGWTLESADPSVFTVDPPQRDVDNRLYATLHTTGDGVADLIVRDDGHHVRERHSIEARMPDSAKLMAHGLLIIGKSESQAEVPEARLLDGGTATFLIHYYKGDRLLYGNGALGVDPPADVKVATPSTWLFEARDWLQVTPSVSGTSSLGLKANGQHFADLPLTVVEPAEITSLRILGANEAHAKQGAWLVALGQAYDAMSRQIFGVAFHWDVDGEAQIGWDGSDTGDLYRYEYDPSLPKMLAASFDTGTGGGLSAVAMIHSSGGYVDSSNHLGCSSAPGAPATAPWLLLLALAPLVLRRRRLSP